jgi:flagellar motor switch/type III secretory pathway protein FliN
VRNPGGVKPFPFAALDALTRADVTTAARLRRVARDVVRLEAVEAALSEVVAERVEIRVRRFRPIDAARGGDDAIGVLLAPAGDRGTSRRMLVEVEGALGAAITARALRQRAPRITDAARAPTPALSGAFAAVLVAALRRAHAGAPLKVISAGPGSALARDLAKLERDVTTAWLTVIVGPDAFDARVSVPDDAAVTARAPAFTHADLQAMGDAPIALPLVVATTLASRAELAALVAGDAFVPPKLGIALHAGGVLLGTVALVPPRGERGIAADLAADGRLVVRGLLETHPWERPMSSDERASDAATTIEVLEDAPVVVRVELGVVEMKAREWAALGTGDVVSLGRKIGDPAILRVGGVELARGELVQVEGEMAVRIVAREKRSTGEGG